MQKIQRFVSRTLTFKCRYWIGGMSGGSSQSKTGGNNRSTIQETSDSRQTQSIAFRGQTNEIFDQDYRNEQERMQSQPGNQKASISRNSENEIDGQNRNTDQNMQGKSDTRSISHKNAQVPTSDQSKSKEAYDEELAGDWGVPTKS